MNGKQAGGWQVATPACYEVRKGPSGVRKNPGESFSSQMLGETKKPDNMKGGRADLLVQTEPLRRQQQWQISRRTPT